MKWADYCVSKLSQNEFGMIDSIYVSEDLGNSLSSFKPHDRNWMVQQVSNGKTFCSIKKNKTGSWEKIGDFFFEQNVFSWHIIPKNSTKHKTFVSYYHKDDQEERNKFENLFSDLIVSKSVEEGDIDSDNSNNYIKRLIQSDYLIDTTVLVVLIGPKTKCRMHIDWEISAAISARVGGYSGLIGILLPNHPDFGFDKKYNSDNLPNRLAANLESGYAKLYDWTDDRVKMQQYIDEAFSNKNNTEKIRNTIPQMSKNSCE